MPLGRINGEILDSFYRELAPCRTHCSGRPFVQHRTVDEHDCNGRCKQHVCRPLAAASLLKVQAILNRAGKRAVRWEWIGRNPFELAEPISHPHSEPRPPTAEQAAVISAEAWRDLDWGMILAGDRLAGQRPRAEPDPFEPFADYCQERLAEDPLATPPQRREGTPSDDHPDDCIDQLRLDGPSSEYRRAGQPLPAASRPPRCAQAAHRAEHLPRVLDRAATEHL